MEDINKEEIPLAEETAAEPTEETPEVLDAPESKTDEMLDRYQRTLAEFDNYRKRTTKEMFAKYDDGVRSACERLLPLLDNFERALNAHDNKEDRFYQGVAMIARQLDDTLAGLGVEPIALEPGDVFDPNFHNAVAHVEDENLGQSQVAAVLQKGYKHKDKVIRYSMVKVAN